MGWWNRQTRRATLAGHLDSETELAELIKSAEKIVRSYSGLVGRSGPNLPESALPYPKDAIRAALITWGLLETNPEMRSGLCAMYGTLEDFLPDAEWKIVHEWRQMAGTKDVAALANATLEAIPLQSAPNQRCIERMKEFDKRMAAQDARRRAEDPPNQASRALASGKSRQ